MHTQWESLANEHILGIAPYEPGKPIGELEREFGIADAIKLASNENPLPPSAKVQKAIAAALNHLNRYPDGSGFYLRQALAKKHGVAVEHIMGRVPERTIVVFDEAYTEFAQGPDFPDTLSYVKQGRKVIVLRTFSKAASLAGLRVGYGVADADAVALMNRIRQPFNVNSLAQAAALAALEDESHILECVRMIEAGRHFLYDEFTALGIRYVPSRANFILVDVGRSASDIYQRLLKEGVIVRPLTPFGLESALRVTVGTPDENRRLVKALKTVLGKTPA